ncbi:MAG: yrpC [Anaerospora sp.]|nr:yrpC [Anaerospora sp.]
MKIGFFDSGIGGLTVLGHALNILPFAEYIYYADIEHLPYGEKTKNEVKQYVQNGMDYMAKIKVDAVVIACNTATSVAIGKLRKNYSVLVLATSLTLREEKFHQLVQRLDATEMVDTMALGGLVKFAEQFKFETAEVQEYLQKELAALTIQDYGAVVLGCTHFPLFNKILQQFFTKETVFFDGSAGTPSVDDKIKFVITDGELPPSDVDYKKILQTYLHTI